MAFPHSSVSKSPACNSGDPGLIPGLGRSPGEENGTPFQYSCLENPVDRGPWQATVHGVARVGHNLATKTNQILYNFVMVFALCQHELATGIQVSSPF